MKFTPKCRTKKLGMIYTIFESFCSFVLKTLLIWTSFLFFILQGFFQQFWEEAPGQNWEKMINIEINKGSKIYPQKLF